MNRPWSILLLLLATAPGAAERITIDRLAWLAGCWATDESEPGTIEVWTPPSGGSMLATSRVITNGRMTWYEFLRIEEQDDGTLSFFPQPSGRPPMEFTMRTFREGHIAFENPDNDFPQVIIYEITGDDRIRARLTELKEDNPRIMDVPMTRVEC